MIIITHLLCRKQTAQFPPYVDDIDNKRAWPVLNAIVCTKTFILGDLSRTYDTVGTL